MSKEVVWLRGRERGSVKSSGSNTRTGVCHVAWVVGGMAGGEFFGTSQSEPRMCGTFYCEGESKKSKNSVGGSGYNVGVKWVRFWRRNVVIGGDF